MIQKIMGTIILLTCLVLVYFFETAASGSGHLKVFHWPAMLLTGIGPLGLILMCVESETIKEGYRFLFMSVKNIDEQSRKNFESFSTTSQKLYAQGPRIIDDLLQEDSSPLVKKNLERLSMRIPPGDIKNMMIVEKDRLKEQIQRAHAMMGLGVKYAPSIGMLGTILGMVQLLSSISDPAMIGSKMSLALLTTFYGLFFSLVVWSPLQQKIGNVAKAIINAEDQAIHWMELMEMRKPIQYFHEVHEENMTASQQPGH